MLSPSRTVILILSAITVAVSASPTPPLHPKCRGLVGRIVEYLQNVFDTTPAAPEWSSSRFAHAITTPAGVFDDESLTRADDGRPVPVAELLKRQATNISTTPVTGPMTTTFVVVETSTVNPPSQPPSTIVITSVPPPPTSSPPQTSSSPPPPPPPPSSSPPSVAPPVTTHAPPVPVNPLPSTSSTTPSSTSSPTPTPTPSSSSQFSTSMHPASSLVFYTTTIGSGSHHTVTAFTVVGANPTAASGGHGKPAKRPPGLQSTAAAVPGATPFADAAVLGLGMLGAAWLL